MQSQATNGDARLVPYLRQSRRKELTISIKEQRRAIEGWAKTNGVTLAEEVIEQGVSGSKSWRERELGKAIAACERGEVAGVIVAFQDRLSRENGLATAEVWQALEAAQARLVCAAEGLDTSTGDHELTFAVKAAIARDQWKRHRTNWANARRNAIERGVPVGEPAGYSRTQVRNEDGKLVAGPLAPNEHAPAMKEAFEARAMGANWAEVAKVLTDAGVVTRAGRTKWSARATERALRNPVYLGTVKSGDFVKEDAHPAIVTRSLWNKVQARRETRGSWAEKTPPALLTGILVCGSCGHRMSTSHTTSGGKRFDTYQCRAQHECPGRVSIGRRRVEMHVLRWMWDTVRIKKNPPPAIDTSHLEAALDKAEEELERFVEATSASELGVDLFQKGIAQRTAARDAARKALSEATPASAYTDNELLTAFYGEGIQGKPVLELLESLTPEKRTWLLAQTIKRVEVRRGSGPVESRVTIERWDGGLGEEHRVGDGRPPVAA